MINEALKYYNLGYCPIPCKGKIPIVKWKEFVTQQPGRDTVEAWFTKSDHDSIGILTGKFYNLFVIDIDGGDQQFYSQVSVKTNKGRHYWFAYPQGVNGTPTNKVRIDEFMDTRGEGGLVILPPSKGYSWIKPLLTKVTMPPPQEVIDKLKPKERTNNSISNRLDNMKEGNRNNTFTSLAGSLRSKGYDSNTIFELLRSKAIEVNFSLSELRTICNSMQRYQPTNSIQTYQGGLKDDICIRSLEEFISSGSDVIEWVVPGLISQSSLGFISGLGESLKTWLLMDLAIETSRDKGEWLGLFPVTKQKVLYIDQERDKIETRRRFKQLLKGKGMTNVPENLNIMHGTSIRLNLDNSYSAFCRKIESLKPTLILLDSFVTFHTAEENNRTDMQKVLERIKEIRRKYGITFVMLEHEGKGILSPLAKDKEPNAHDIMGSSSKVQAAEFVFTVRRHGQRQSKVYHTKATTGPSISPFLVTVEDIEEGISTVVRGI